MSGTVKRGTELEIRIESLAFGGKAVAKRDGLVVFLDRGLPGQTVKARVFKKKKQYAEARLLEVLEPAEGEQPPFCPHFGYCGGCRWQDLAYSEQLRWKRQHVLDSVLHLAGVEDADVEATVPSQHRRYYRNKMEYTFSDRRWLLPEEIATGEEVEDRDFALGLHLRGAFDKVFNLETCFLESPESPVIVREARDWCKERGLPAYGIKTHQGFWRNLVVREGKHTGQRMINVVTAPHPRGAETVRRLAERLLDAVPDVTTLVHSVNSSRAQVAVGESMEVLHGPGYIEETLGERRFRISPNSFFQTNSYAAGKLYDSILEFADFSGGETVWDLYCGTGSIALYLAGHVRSVAGYELVEDAVTDARLNAELNGVDNCVFRAGDLKDLIREIESAGPHGAPDVVVVDPPRAGMHPRVVKGLLTALPKRIVAVSCNPATLARDLEMLSERYRTGSFRPFDFFPHTPHIECVVRLDRK